ncbi:MAG: sugar phosphate nucleotidyltransferase [Bacteroidia bacterium]|nr:sugar phosphate nucleotidyltransferase [Bacteroidia bacterium]
MRILIPMAGMGKRLRPHTLTVPKPLFPIAGKPIVERLVEDLARLYGQPIDEVAFITGDFGPETERQLVAIAERLGAKGRIYHQAEALGTAHAVYCAAELLEGELIIGFADTLFTADFALDTHADGVIWTKRVDDPRAFGVVTLDGQGVITGMVEKPKDFVSDQAIIGIYFLRDGAALKREIEHLLTHNLRTGGEYQLTDALEALRQKGARLVTGTVDRWMDCGNKANVLDTNHQILELTAASLAVPPSAVVKGSVLIPPVFVGEGAVIQDAVVGPYTTVGAGAVIERAVVAESIVREKAEIRGVSLTRSIVGVHATCNAAGLEVNLGDYSQHG